jgi:hypothetical protein
VTVLAAVGSGQGCLAIHALESKGQARTDQLRDCGVGHLMALSDWSQRSCCALASAHERRPLQFCGSPSCQSLYSSFYGLQGLPFRVAGAGDRMLHSGVELHAAGELLLDEVPSADESEPYRAGQGRMGQQVHVMLQALTQSGFRGKGQVCAPSVCWRRP